MTSLAHENFMTFCEAPKEKRKDASFVLDALKRTIFQLSKSKLQLDETIALDQEIAVQSFTNGRRESAVEALHRVTQKQVFKEYVSVALFQLVAVRLEMELKTSRNGSFRVRRKAVKEAHAMIYKILRRLDSCPMAPRPSDAVLLEEPAIQVNHDDEEGTSHRSPITTVS
mmetsp:Transcript_258/g.485  ORF Transcript_258/g.485 Transcript_258/m.485 type:complete len:170 (-) Transcript_258:13-522(-)|eukprot:scaffold574_cov190-Amphora_coffeaeformis.AAC.6